MRLQCVSINRSQVEHYMLFETITLLQFIEKFNEEEGIIRQRINVGLPLPS